MLHRSQLLSLYLVLYLAAVLLFSFVSISVSFIYFSATLAALILFWRLRAVRFVLLFTTVVLLAACQLTNIPRFFDPEKEGNVASEPQIFGSQQRMIVRNQAGVRFLISLPTYPKIEIGDRIVFEGDLTEARDSDSFHRDPGYIFLNKIDYLVEDGAFFSNQGNAKQDTTFDYYSVRRSLIRTRGAYEKVLLKILPGPYNGLAIGILLGNREYLPNSLNALFIITGIVHIMALSGYNVTIIAGNLEKLLKSQSARWASLFAIGGIWVFVAATGLSASVIRAAIMGTVLILGKRFGRQNDSLVTILLTAAVMVFLNPYLLRYDIGFQLSFMAMLGMIFLAPALAKYLKPLGRNFSGIISATIAAQLFTLPLLSYHFGRVSLVSLVANMLVLPFIPIIMALTFGVATVGLISIWLAQKLAFVLWALLAYIVEVSESLAAVPLAQYRYQMTALAMIGFYLLLFELVIILRKRDIGA